MSTRANALAAEWGKAIQAHRENIRKQTRAEFAADLDVSRQTVRNWEVGEYVPSPHWQAKLVQLLGLGPNEIHKFYAAAAQDETAEEGAA